MRIEGGLGGGQKPYPIPFGIKIDKRITSFGVDNIGLLDDGIINYEITEDLYNDFLEDADKYTYDKISQKVVLDPNYQ